jgi:hypothetical protein
MLSKDLLGQRKNNPFELSAGGYESEMSLFFADGLSPHLIDISVYMPGILELAPYFKSIPRP